MAFPFIFESNFETGNTTEWDTETDVAGVLNVRHYTYLAREDATTVGPIAPWRGAYVAEWNLVGDTADHTLIAGPVDIGDTVTRYARFYLFIGKDFRATADDTFNIYEAQGGTAAENSIGLRITAATQAIEIGVGKLAPTVFATQLMQRGQWYCIDLKTFIDAGGTGTGTLYVNGSQVAQVTTLTNAVVIQGVLGTQDTLTTTLGHLYMDCFVFDDTLIGPHQSRYPETQWLTKTTHVCLGYSDLLNVTLLPGTSTDSVLKVYDTDRADTSDESNIVAHLYNLTASEPPIDLADVPAPVKRGAYAVLSGTAPRALIRIGSSQGYGSAGRVRQHGWRNKHIPFGDIS